MNIKIPAPYGSEGLSISLIDVSRVENRSFAFFESCMYNLYIVVRAHQKEDLFTLYSYKEEKEMLFAFETISSLLKNKINDCVTLEMEPKNS